MKRRGVSLRVSASLCDDLLRAGARRIDCGAAWARLTCFLRPLRTFRASTALSPERIPMRINPSAVLLAALLALGACRDLPTVSAPPEAAPGPAAQDRVPVRCSVVVAARTISCAAPQEPRGMRANVILGGQGLNVRLTSTG